MFNSRTDKGFYTMTICRADLPPQGLQEGKNTACWRWKRLNLHLRQLKPHLLRIRTWILCSTNTGEKKLLTNTLALGINHMHAQTNNVQKHRLSQQIEGWQTSLSFPHDDSEYNDSWRAAKHLLLKRKMWTFRFLFYFIFFSKKDSSSSAPAIFCIELTSCALFCSAHVFIFVMIKVRSCKVNDKFSAVKFTFGFSS